MVNVSLKLGEMLIIGEALEIINKQKGNFLGGLNRLAAQNIMKKFRAQCKRKINKDFFSRVYRELLE